MLFIGTKLIGSVNHPSVFTSPSPHPLHRYFRNGDYTGVSSLWPQRTTAIDDLKYICAGCGERRPALNCPGLSTPPICVICSSFCVALPPPLLGKSPPPGNHTMERGRGKPRANSAAPSRCDGRKLRGLGKEGGGRHGGGPIRRARPVRGLRVLPAAPVRRGPRRRRHRGGARRAQGRRRRTRQPSQYFILWKHNWASFSLDRIAMLFYNLEITFLLHR